MADITDLPIMSKADAKAIGFAGYNDVAHKPIDIPDGYFTITAKTSEGRRVTFCFMPETCDGPSRFVDIQFHDRRTTVADADGGQQPTFDTFGIAKGGKHIIDSRKLDEAEKPSILVVLLDTKAETDERAKAASPKHEPAPTAKQPNWATAFPDYPKDALPKLPASWTDLSWKHDTAPSFGPCTGPMGEMAQLWIDYLRNRADLTADQREQLATRIFAAREAAVQGPARAAEVAEAINLTAKAQAGLRDALAGRLSAKQRRAAARLNLDRITRALGLIASIASPV